MLHDLHIVLVRPEHGGNVGGAARALKNMGLSQLVLVDATGFDPGAAERLAHGAEDVLHRARHVSTLAEALADSRWSVATTRRRGRHRLPHYTPRSFARRVVEEPERRPLAIVFGPEKDGLTDADLSMCHERLSIPSTEAHPSLNLAQAVLVVCYELYVHASQAESSTAEERAPEATGAECEAMYAHLEEVLREVGFVHPHTVAHQMRAFRQLLSRARLEPADVSLLRGLWRQTLWAARRGEPPGAV